MTTKHVIETRNLRLVPCELVHFEAILEDPVRLEHLLGVRPAEGWLQFPESMRVGYDYLRAHPDALGWWTYLFNHRTDRALIGVGGFAGIPDADGIVEIGYSIAPAYRKRGLATEAARGFVKRAFSAPEINMVDAHTLSTVNPSTTVLEKIGMTRIGTATDRDEGEVWHWRIGREDYERTKGDGSVDKRNARKTSELASVNKSGQFKSRNVRTE